MGIFLERTLEFAVFTHFPDNTDALKFENHWTEKMAEASGAQKAAMFPDHWEHLFPIAEWTWVSG